MTATIAVIVPTFGRPDRLAEVALNIIGNTTYPVRVVFVVEQDDADTLNAVYNVEQNVECVDYLLNRRAHNYAGACNTAYLHTTEPYLFTGSDDLAFHAGWDVQAMAAMGDWHRVVGTNDMLNPYVARGTHSTHSLVSRGYLDFIGGVVDEGAGSFLFEGYDHQYVDAEFIDAARWRDRFIMCQASVVEHKHYLVGKAAHDATYTRAYAHEREDAEVYKSRLPLWGNVSNHLADLGLS